jgi:predicted lipid-binding transport protein (Tim44 family)
MDPVSDERGQALIIAVLFLAIAAVVIGGLRTAQVQILAAARDHRAGEAAAEAATAVVADAYVAELRRAAASTASPPPTPNVASALSTPATRESARAAASDLSVRNGGGPISEVAVRCERGSVDVTLMLNGRRYRAGFAASQCSQP